MNDEIREILDRLDFEEWEVDLYKVPITWCELYDIRDYITNLQKENERLKELVDADNESYDIQETIINRQKSELLEQEDYKSRCENAYEELTYMSSSNYVEDYDIKQNCWIKLSNILQNGSDTSVKD